MADRIRIRRDTAANWYTHKPRLALGEAGYELDTGFLKIGNEVDTYDTLPYVTLGGTLPVDHGGTSAATATAARTNLNVPAHALSFSSGNFQFLQDETKGGFEFFDAATQTRYCAEAVHEINNPVVLRMSALKGIEGCRLILAWSGENGETSQWTLGDNYIKGQVISYDSKNWLVLDNISAATDAPDVDAAHYMLYTGKVGVGVLKWYYTKNSNADTFIGGQELAVLNDVNTVSGDLGALNSVQVKHEETLPWDTTAVSSVFGALESLATEIQKKQYTASANNPIDITNNVISLSGVVSVANGGTGAGTFTEGEVLIGHDVGAVTTLGFDAAPVDGSNKLLTSGSIYAVLNSLTGGASGSISSLLADITALQGRITTVEEEVNTAKSDIVTNTTDISGLTTRMGTAEGDITDNADDIGALDSRMGTAEGKITPLETDVSGLKTNINAIYPLGTTIAAGQTKPVSGETIKLTLSDLENLLCTTDNKVDIGITDATFLATSTKTLVQVLTYIWNHRNDA